MVALVAEHIIDLLPLRREPKARGPQLFGQVLLIHMAAGLHYGFNLAERRKESRFRIILSQSRGSFGQN